MGREVFRVEFQRLLEPGNGTSQKCVAPSLIRALEFGSFKQCLAKLVKRDIVLGKIEAALNLLPRAVFNKTAKVLDRLLELKYRKHKLVGLQVVKSFLDSLCKDVVARCGVWGGHF